MESSFYGNTKVFPNNNINLKDKLDILFITVTISFLHLKNTKIILMKIQNLITKWIRS